MTDPADGLSEDEPICPCGHPVREHPHLFPGNAYCPDCRRGWIEALLASGWRDYPADP